MSFHNLFTSILERTNFTREAAFVGKIYMYSKLTLFCAGLNFFRVNNYGIQIVFFFVYINLQIAFAFFVASFFSSVKIATGQ